jgi:cation transport regulator ChaC
MTLYFAYGSNMSRAPMRARCPSATLSGYRLIVTSDGYASVVPEPGGVVHGLVWRLAPRDIAALNAYESLDTGLYRIVTLPVRLTHVPAKWSPVRRQGHAPMNRITRQVPAMVYLARSDTPGLPRPGYLEPVLAAARELDFPPAYVDALARWLPAGRRAPGEVA